MSFDRMPSKSEVMGWNPHQLADYLRRLDLSGCDKVIAKCNMNGQRFLNMTDNDLQKFPKIHAPLITKICCEINRKEEKRGFFSKRSPAPKYNEPEIPQEEQPWGPDEFSDASDDDYESPDAEDDDGSGGDYESPTEEPEAGGEDCDNDYEPPPSEPPEEIPPQFRAPKVFSDHVYVDRTSRSQPPPPPQRPGTGPPAASLSRPSLAEHAARREPSPQRPGRQPGKLPGPFTPAPLAPPVDRRIKPTKLDRTNMAESPIQARKNTERPVPPSWRAQTEESRVPKPAIPVSANVSRSSSSVGRALPSGNRCIPRNEVHDEVSKPVNSHTFPRPGIPRPTIPPESFSNISATASLPSRLQALQASITHRGSSRGVMDRQPPQPGQCSMPPPAEQEDEQDLNPKWYVGQVTRGQAEDCLRQVNKDGAFLVRDSSKRSSTQPYTLMVLYQAKVYNIQIRCEHNEFLLGTGLKASETFPMVADIIGHYRQTPLLLIDAKNRGSGQQNQCPLIYPAGAARF
ncbi:lymphocyte cytosolic protein 2a [Esox lucius]|uniref:Lymphocyte cytosolic protein 2 n=1 Tax=Esox lucius TaxID=8010 RepID=A0A3P8Z2R0_ESOLU|nr:lymphocyte cytosolic protein 2a [Esox lucius]